MQSEHLETASPSPSGLPEELRSVSELLERIRQAVAQVLVGQRVLVERLLVGLLTGGHVLLEGVPGLGKTLAVRALGRVLEARFQRIQFTPDLLPADVVGTVVYDPQQRRFEPRPGPIFAHLVLADEINRAPAKVQSALLQAMQERQVTLGERTFVLPQPFLVLATQNPLEQEGTYPLAEAQLDRFMLHVRVGYPTRPEEREIVRRMGEAVLRPPGEGDDPVARLRPVAHPEDLLRARAALRHVHLDPRLLEYVLDIVQATRQPERHRRLAELRPYIEYGASPRASIALAVGGRALALLQGRRFVLPDDVKDLAPDVLRHRIGRTPEAEAEDVSTDTLVQRILEAVEVP